MSRGGAYATDDGDSGAHAAWRRPGTDATAFGRDLDNSLFSLRTIGLDIGSSTTHFTVSRLDMALVGSRYVPVQRAELFSSPVLLTPYRGTDEIDSEVVAAFLAEQFKAGELDPAGIHAGAVILTGHALAQRNSRLVADLFAEGAGRFVVASAGDVLEGTLSAYGSGAVALSRERESRILHVDIGGGTTKFAICDSGEVLEATALDVGARVVVVDQNRRITRITSRGEQLAASLGLQLRPGDMLTAAEAVRMCDYMADRIVDVIVNPEIGRDTRQLHLAPALEDRAQIAAVSFAGGVSEFLYDRERATFGDLGRDLAKAVDRRVRAAEVELTELPAGIRSTVTGAAQFTVQVSSQTILADPRVELPMLSVPVLAPPIELADETVDAVTVRTRTERALGVHGLGDGSKCVAVGLRWSGTASYERIRNLCCGLADAMGPIWTSDRPAVVVLDADVARLVGRELQEHTEAPVIAIDGVELNNFDYIDIGYVDEGLGVLPVVVKSLMFPET